MGLFCFWKREFPNSESYLLDLEKRFPNFEKVHFLILEMLFFPDLEMCHETAECMRRQSSSTSIGIVRNLSTRCLLLVSKIWYWLNNRKLNHLNILLTNNEFIAFFIIFTIHMALIINYFNMWQREEDITKLDITEYASFHV